MERGIPPENWDEKVAQLDGNVLQSREWAEFQSALGKKVMHAAGDGWCWMAVLEQRRTGSYLYAPYGPTVSSTKNLGEAIDSLTAAAKELGCDFVRFEPIGPGSAGDVSAAGAQAVDENQPQRTITLDLTPDADALRRDVSQSTRNLINTAESRGVNVVRAESPHDCGAFLALVAKTVQHQGIHLYGEDYFRTLLETLMPSGFAKLHYATYQGKTVAAAVTLDFAGTRYYLFAASDYELNREAKASAPLLFELIVDAKNAGMTTFDFCGIAPTDDPNDKKAGVTRFKLAFSKNIVTRVGTWDLPVSATKYRLYRLARRISK